MTTNDSHPSAEYLRIALHSYLAHQFRNEPGTILIDELGISRGSARVDIAAVGRQFHGYEIKSERDDLRRLAAQASLYGRVFDRVTLVCGDRHLSRALDIIPSWWGIIRVIVRGEQPTFKYVRRGRKSPDRETRAIVELLWLDEAMALLERRNALRGLRGKPRDVLWDKVSELFGIDEVTEAVRTHLRATSAMRGRPAPQS